MFFEEAIHGLTILVTMFCRMMPNYVTPKSLIGAEKIRGGFGIDYISSLYLIGPFSFYFIIFYSLFFVIVGFISQIFIKLRSMVIFLEFFCYQFMIDGNLWQFISITIWLTIFTILVILGNLWQAKNH